MPAAPAESATTGAAARTPRVCPGPRRPRDARRSFTVTLILVVILAALPVAAAPLGRWSRSRRRPDVRDQRAVPAVGPQHVHYNGHELDVYVVPLPTARRDLALLKPGRATSQFIDPAKPDCRADHLAGLVAGADRAWTFAPQWENFATCGTYIDFPGCCSTPSPSR